ELMMATLRCRFVHCIVELPEPVLFGSGAAGPGCQHGGVTEHREVPPFNSELSLGNVLLNELRLGDAAVTCAERAAVVGKYDHHDRRIDRADCERVISFPSGLLT